MSDSESAGAAVTVAESPRQHFWATELPMLRAGMLTAAARQPYPFPFSHPSVEYVHFARNAIYALAWQLGLAEADVLVPAYCHGVEVEALIAAGVRVRFFPVHAGMQVDPDEIRRLLRPDTRAIYLIHYLGFPGPVRELRSLCDERGLLLIEDCALALLSRLGDEWLGSTGDAAVFCLYKTLPTVDGGAAVLKEGRLQFNGVPPRRFGTAREVGAALLAAAERNGSGAAPAMVRWVRSVARAVSRPERSNWVHVGTQHFERSDANLLMSGVSRRIVAGQDFDAIVHARRRNYLHLESLLRDLRTPVFAGLPAGVCPLFYPFTTRRKREVWSRLRGKGIQAVTFWTTTTVKGLSDGFPETETLRNTVLELPCHQDMTPRLIERVAQEVRAVVRELES